MAEIANIIDSRNRKGRIQSLIDTSFKRMMDNDSFLNEYMPIVPYQDCVAVWLNAKMGRPIASVVSTSECAGEIPNKQMRKKNTVLLEQEPFKIGVQHLWKEDVIHDLYKLGYDPGSNNRDVPQAFMDFLFGDIDLIPEMIMSAAKRYAWDVLIHGLATYRDEFTGIVPCIDYTPLLVDGVNIPEPLTGDKAWDQLETANALADLHRHGLAMKKLNGFMPDVYVMNSNTFEMVQFQESTKRAWLMRNGMTKPCKADLAALELCVDEVNMAKPNCVNIEVFDGWYETEDKDGNCERHYYIPDGYYVGLTNIRNVSADIPGSSSRRGVRGGMGEIFSTPTVESGRAALNRVGRPSETARRMRPGIHVWTKEISDSPVIDAIKGVANMGIKIHNPRTISSRKVY